MVKAIFFDIDGTLVSFQTHCIPASTRQALEELHHRGIKLFIATGRPKWLMMHAIGNLPFDGFITLNGVHCFTSNRKDIHKDCIPQEDINRLIDFHKENPDMPFVFVHDNTWFITHVNKDVEEISRYIEVELPPVFPIEKAAEKDILQIMGYFTSDNDQTLFKSVLPHCQPMRWHPLFTDIISKGNSKSNGIGNRGLSYVVAAQDVGDFAKLENNRINKAFEAGQFQTLNLETTDFVHQFPPFEEAAEVLRRPLTLFYAAT